MEETNKSSQNPESLKTQFPPQTITYRLVCKMKVGDLNERVSELINEGWLIHGQPFGIPSPNYTEYCQGLMKSEDKSEDKKEDKK